MDPIEQLVIGSWGEIKTCKSTFGLTFPTPWVMFDFDLGFARAKHRLPWLQPGKTLLEIPAGIALTSDILASADMIVKSYHLPIKMPKASLRGWVSVWDDEILPDIVLTIETQRIRSLLYDTGTVMWNISKDAQLERAQTVTSSRISLLPVEYTMPNGQMRAVLGSAKHYGKNLYIAHHLGGKYQDVISTKGTDSIRVGDTWDGWNHLGAIVDIIMRTGFAEGPIRVAMPPEKWPIATIETCGLTLSAEGQVVNIPTFDSVLALINSQREADGLSMSTVQLPATPAGLIPISTVPGIF